jgi:hypothetical protein
MNLRNLLPDEISDEGAYHLVNFFMELTAVLESHYFAKMKRYIDESVPPQLPASLLDNQINEDNTF